MSIVNYFDHHDRKASKEHYLNLVQMACADGVIDPSELELLHRIGKRLGFTDPEIDELIGKKASKHFSPSYSLERRFHELYDIVAMALADGILHKAEIGLIKKFAIALAFSSNEIDRVVEMLVAGIKSGKSEEELFSLFKA
jgi:uncharacterized tellurite resistance protein B-like protein